MPVRRRVFRTFFESFRLDQPAPFTWMRPIVANRSLFAKRRDTLFKYHCGFCPLDTFPTSPKSNENIRQFTIRTFFRFRIVDILNTSKKPIRYSNEPCATFASSSSSSKVRSRAGGVRARIRTFAANVSPLVVAMKTSRFIKYVFARRSR